MISVVWLVSAILSVPVWAGTVLFQRQATSSTASVPHPVTAWPPNGTTALLMEALSEDDEGGYHYWMNLCYR